MSRNLPPTSALRSNEGIMETPATQVRNVKISHIGCQGLTPAAVVRSRSRPQADWPSIWLPD
jgi:hypothetical protein